LCAAPLVIAEDSAPKNFYKKDYASAPGAQGRDEAAEAPRRGSTPNSRDDVSSANATATPKAKEPKNLKRRVVMRVYVNSKDREHLQSVLNEVYRLHDERKAFVLSVEHIGDYTAITPQIEEDLKARSIELLASSQPSLDLGLTTSPAWVIQTPQGAHTAEGIIAISAFFNEYGEYDPKRSPDSESKTKIEGF